MLWSNRGGEGALVVERLYVDGAAQFAGVVKLAGISEGERLPFVLAGMGEGNVSVGDGAGDNAFLVSDDALSGDGCVCLDEVAGFCDGIALDIARDAPASGGDGVSGDGSGE